MSQNTSFLAMEKDVTERLNKVVSSALLKERERKEKNLNSHSCNVYLQLRYIYIQG